MQRRMSLAQQLQKLCSFTQGLVIVKLSLARPNSLSLLQLHTEKLALQLRLTAPLQSRDIVVPAFARILSHRLETP